MYHSIVKVVTASAMKALDRRAIEAGMPAVVLMENAGAAVFRAVQALVPQIRGQLVRVVCGTGNNGGDGFVAARLLHLGGAEVDLQLVGDSSRIAGPAEAQYRLVCGRPIRSFRSRPYLIIDAILGTGATGTLRPDVASAVDAINAQRCPVVSVDVPTGVDADTGATNGPVVSATVTVTFGYPKAGLLLAPGCYHSGRIVVDGIGFDWDALEPESAYTWLGPDCLEQYAVRRGPESHKGTYGHVLVVGGSRDLPGAPRLASRAALRAGAGLITAAVPASVHGFFAAERAEIMPASLPETDGALAENSVTSVLELAARATGLCVGPGAGRSASTQSALMSLVMQRPCGMVLDADGLYALSHQLGWTAGSGPDLVLTPHPGECAGLLGITTQQVQADRVAAVRTTALKFNCIVVLKGARTLVADGRQGTVTDIAINSTGNAGMANGGMGDALAGLIAALLARGMDGFWAACLGVYLHGRAGDLARDKIGETGMAAGDVIECVPAAVRELEATN